MCVRGGGTDGNGYLMPAHKIIVLLGYHQLVRLSARVQLEWHKRPGLTQKEKIELLTKGWNEEINENKLKLSSKCN